LFWEIIFSGWFNNYILKDKNVVMTLKKQHTTHFRNCIVSQLELEVSCCFFGKLFSINDCQMWMINNLELNFWDNQDKDRGRFHAEWTHLPVKVNHEKLIAAKKKRRKKLKLSIKLGNWQIKMKRNRAECKNLKFWNVNPKW